MRQLVFDDLFQEEITLTEVVCDSQAAFFKQFADILTRDGYVAPSFETAIIERERVFPTGLEMNGITIAIPHTDTMHVKRPFVAVSKLAKPLSFVQMGTTDKWVDAEMIFILGIKDAAGQVPLLATMMEKFADETFVEALRQQEQPQELVAFLKKQFGRVTK